MFARFRRVLIAAPLGFLVPGCGDDAGAVAGPMRGSDGTTDARADRGSGTATAGVRPPVETDDTAAADPTGGGLTDDTDSVPSQVSLFGRVQDFYANTPIGGAKITVLGDEKLETIETTSGDDGSYRIDGLTPGAFVRLRLADSKAYWGSVIPVQLPQEDLEQDLSQVSLSAVSIQESVLVSQDPNVRVDETAAAMIIAIRQNTAAGDATFAIDPPVPETQFYAPDAGGMPRIGSNRLDWVPYPVGVIFNLEPSSAGTYEVSVVHSERSCVVEDPSPPTFSRTINLVPVDCPPPA